MDGCYQPTSIVEAIMTIKESVARHKSRLGLGLAIGILLALAPASHGIAAEKTLRFAHMWPPTSGWGRAAQEFADLVAKKTGGKIEIKLFPQGQLGNERENEESLQLGNLDLTFGGPGVLTNFDPKIGIFDMPFMFHGYDHANAVMDGSIGKKIFESLRKNAGIRVLASGAQGFRNVLTKGKSIGSMADIKGVKIRTPEADTYIRTFRLIGANPVPVAWGDTYMAVQSGVVDGMEGTPDVMRNFKMFEVGKNVAITGHILATLQLLVSEKVYQEMSADIQKVLSDAAVEAWHKQRDAAQVGNEDALAELEKKMGVKISKPDLKPFQKAVSPLWNEWAKKAGATDLVDAIQKM